MPYRRGDVVAVPYDYTNLRAGKVRPAVIVSSDPYNSARPDVVAAGISSQVAKVSQYDAVLRDWPSAGLRYPSLVRGRLLTIEQGLIRYTVGRLSSADLDAVEEKVISFLISDPATARHLVSEVDLVALPGRLVHRLAEKAIHASLRLAARGDQAIDIERLRAVFPSIEQ